MTVRYTKGSVLPFVAIGVVLLIALAVTFYTIRHRSEQAKNAAQPSVQVTPQSPADSSPDTSGTKPPTPENNPTTNTPQTQHTDQSGAGGNTSGSGTGALPKTGPQDTLISIGVIALVAYTLSSYLQSRRQLQRLF